MVLSWTQFIIPSVQNYPKGIVSWQSPTENDSIRKGFGVRIEVSNGLAPNDLVDVPDFQGIFLLSLIHI